MIAKQRLWLTADFKRLVPDGDPKASLLYCTPGHAIPASAAKMYGLVDGRLSGPKTPLKEAERPEDKEAAVEEDKHAPSKGEGGGGLKIMKRKK